MQALGNWGLNGWYLRPFRGNRSWKTGKPDLMQYTDSRRHVPYLGTDCTSQIVSRRFALRLRTNPIFPIKAESSRQ